MSAKIKFPKVSGANQKLFAEAMNCYKQGKYSECYEIISNLAASGVARACYCKALLDVNPRIPDAEGDDAFFDGIKKAASMKYPLAYGLLAIYYYEGDKYNELVELCIANKKLAEPRLMTMLAAIYDGFYSEGSAYANEKRAAKTFAAAGALFENCIKTAEKSSPEWEENDVYLGARTTLKHTYALLNRLIMISYKFSDVYANRNLYREAYNRASYYATDPLFLFGAHRINAETLMDDIMGLSDLKAVNKSMQLMEEAYQNLDEELQELNSETYDNVWDKYKEYYESESERLASLNLHATSDLTALFPGMGVGDMISGIARGVQRWANSPMSSTETYYEIDGKKYKKGDNLGYLYDEDGIRSNYRIDDVDRLHGEGDRELGYFSTDGIFMPKK